MLRRKKSSLLPTDHGQAKPYEIEIARITTIVLAEFAGLRSEIATRINILVTLILGNLTVLGLVLGITLGHPGNTSVLLLLPIVTPCIGMIVIDTFRNIDFLGKYISEVIRPQLQIKSRINDLEVFDWERKGTEQAFTVWIAAPFQLVLCLEFLGPPIAILIYAIQRHLSHPYLQISTLQRWLWWTGAVLTGVLILYAAIYGTYSVRHPQGAKGRGK